MRTLRALCAHSLDVKYIKHTHVHVYIVHIRVHTIRVLSASSTQCNTKRESFYAKCLEAWLIVLSIAILNELQRNLVESTWIRMLQLWKFNCCLLSNEFSNVFEFTIFLEKNCPIFFKFVCDGTIEMPIKLRKKCYAEAFLALVALELLLQFGCRVSLVLFVSFCCPWSTVLSCSRLLHTTTHAQLEVRYVYTARCCGQPCVFHAV